MKTYDEMTYDEQDRYLDWAEAEYCPDCGGRGMRPNNATVSGKDDGYVIVGWSTCDRCKGTGRA